MAGVNTAAEIAVPSAILSGTRAGNDDTSTGEGGAVTIQARAIAVSQGGSISTDTRGEGNAGAIRLSASDRIQLEGQVVFPDETLRSQLLSASSGTGNAGSIGIETGQLSASDGAQISVSSRRAGLAGDINIAAAEVALDGGTISATLDGTSAQGGGNITLNTRSLRLRDGGRIETNASGQATGGNITIQTGTLVAFPNGNNDISASAPEGQGGNIAITAEGVFGTQFRGNLTPVNDIVAIGGTPELQGTVELNSPEVETATGLVALPEDIVDATVLFDRDPCAQGQGSEFAATGRGGLPPNPADALHHSLVLVDLGTWTLTPELVEAQGWAIAADGSVELTAPTPVSELVRQALQAYETADYANAATLWAQAAEVFAREGNEAGLVKSLSNLAASYGHLGEWQSADRALDGVPRGTSPT
ncbi:MAG: S-layer family protein [Coleofasciculaceae cyanobacterium SM2_3_26]|nr:S-layer family protein [Coleofasciculaceae cyanobacterium SM2_3_26]